MHARVCVSYQFPLAELAKKYPAVKFLGMHTMASDDMCVA